MTVTLGLVANLYNEIHALSGWLETHTPFFDDVRVLHAGPNGEWSNDGTIELLKKWNIPVAYCAIDEGFGVVRTKAIRWSPCDYVIILDADERFYPVCRVLTCSGESTPYNEVDAILQTYDFRQDAQPCNWENIARLGAGLRVDAGVTFDQGQHLRQVLGGGPDAVATIRRHWHDFSFRRPTQNWHTDPDWQCRILRNDDSIYFDVGTRMHERIVGANNVVHAETTRGPFFDHVHLFFKRMEIEQRSHDVAIYDRIHKGEKPPTLEEYRGVKR